MNWEQLAQKVLSDGTSLDGFAIKPSKRHLPSIGIPGETMSHIIELWQDSSLDKDGNGLTIKLMAGIVNTPDQPDKRPYIQWLGVLQCHTFNRNYCSYGGYSQYFTILAGHGLRKALTTEILEAIIERFYNS